MRLLGYGPGPPRPSNRRTFPLDEALTEFVYDLAEQEQRPAQDVALDLLTSGLAQRDLELESVQRWQTLSPREQQVAALVCQGYTNRQIAEELSLSVRTVEGHRSNLTDKLGLRSRVELVRYAREAGLLSRPG